MTRKVSPTALLPEYGTPSLPHFCQYRHAFEVWAARFMLTLYAVSNSSECQRTWSAPTRTYLKSCDYTIRRARQRKLNIRVNERRRRSKQCSTARAAPKVCPFISWTAHCSNAAHHCHAAAVNRKRNKNIHTSKSSIGDAAARL